MDLNRKGKTVIIVTHNPKIVKYADRVILVKDQIINTMEGESICK